MRVYTEANTITVLLDHCSEFVLLGPAQHGSYIYLPVILKSH